MMSEVTNANPKDGQTKGTSQIDAVFGSQVGRIG